MKGGDSAVNLTAATAAALTPPSPVCVHLPRSVPRGQRRSCVAVGPHAAHGTALHP